MGVGVGSRIFQCKKTEDSHANLYSYQLVELARPFGKVLTIEQISDILTANLPSSFFILEKELVNTDICFPYYTSAVLAHLDSTIQISEY